MDYILNEQHNPLQITLLIPYRTIYSAQVIKQVVIKQSVIHAFLVTPQSEVYILTSSSCNSTFSNFTSFIKILLVSFRTFDYAHI